MKPFNVNRNSWHYKLNKHFFNVRGENDWYMQDCWEPLHSNFCAYWRATMFRLFFAVFFGMIALGFFGILGFAAYSDPMGAAILIGGGGGPVATAIGLAVGFQALEDRKLAKLNSGAPRSLFMQKYKAYKSKVCPMVEFDK